VGAQANARGGPPAPALRATTGTRRGIRVSEMSEHRHWDPHIGMDVVRYDPVEGACGRCGAALDGSGRCPDPTCPYHELAGGHAYLAG